MLLAIPVGIAVGYLARGRIENLIGIRFHWGALAVAGLLVQLVLFTRFGHELAGPWEPAIYVGSTLVVFAVVLRNARLVGMPIVALGALSNLAAILANGGAMPASAEAIRAAGLDGPGEHTNSVVLDQPALEPLTDIFAIPASWPLANVFSIGDVLIGLGIIVVIAAAMRSARAPEAAPLAPVDASESSVPN